MQWLNDWTCSVGRQLSIRAILQAAMPRLVGSALQRDISFRLPLVRQMFGSKLDLV